VPSRSPLSPKACCPGMGSGSRSWAAGRPGSWRRPTQHFGSPPARARQTPSPLPRCLTGATTTDCSRSLDPGRRPRSSRCSTRFGEVNRRWRLRGSPTSAVLDAADQRIVLDFVDERSVVQTRFAITTLALLRASLGQDLEPVIGQADQAVVADLPAGLLERTQFTCLGSGWTVGLANEAALKMREACLKWTESYPAMEYRHGPISITDARSAVWFLTHPSASLRRRSRELRLSYSPPRGGRWRSS
jgi:hypothetical protein